MILEKIDDQLKFNYTRLEFLTKFQEALEDYGAKYKMSKTRLENFLDSQIPEYYFVFTGEYIKAFQKPGYSEKESVMVKNNDFGLNHLIDMRESVVRAIEQLNGIRDEERIAQAEQVFLDFQYSLAALSEFKEFKYYFDDKVMDNRLRHLI